jgi:uncharacterized membrane protein YdbT with pleckstrin-like domain
LRSRILSLLRVRDFPGPATADAFRASPRHLRYLGCKWLAEQVAGLIGLVVSFVFLGLSEASFLRLEESAQLDFLGLWELNPIELLQYFELFVIALFVIQFFATGYLLKLSWELRWYVVGDDLLRLREGLWRVREQTMTLANIQNMRVRQGPLQRFFGIADLEIRTAGGGSAADSEGAGESEETLHAGHFRGLEDAHGLRERLQAQLLLRKDAGLGDADDRDESVLTPEPDGLATAAQELLAEARALRRAMTS